MTLTSSAVISNSPVMPATTSGISFFFLLWTPTGLFWSPQGLQAPHHSLNPHPRSAELTDPGPGKDFQEAPHTPEDSRATLTPGPRKDFQEAQHTHTPHRAANPLMPG